MTASPFTLMVQGHNRMIDARLAAGWDCDPDHGWGSPEGITEWDWEHVLGYPLPEDEDFAAWASAYYHHEAADADLDPTNLEPYPASPGFRPT